MAKHFHKAKYDEETGKLTDECAECGKNFRDTTTHFTLADMECSASDIETPCNS